MVLQLLLEEREKERQKTVAEKRAEEARRRLKELELNNYQPQEWETREVVEEVRW